jgi:hypothetical protein
MSDLLVRVVTIIASFVVFVCFLASCTTSKTYRLYEGQQLPNDKTVRLINKGSKILVRGDKILVYSVDGVECPDGKKIYSSGRFELLPGDHTLTVSFYRFFTRTQGCAQYYYRSTSTRKVDVTFRTETGHTYLMTSRQDPKKEKWYFVVTDEVEGRRILEAGPYPCETVEIWLATPPVSYCT